VDRGPAPSAPSALAGTNADAPRITRVAFGIAVGLYVVAKLAELSDHAIYAQLGLISGHTLKRMLATMASVVVVAQLTWRERWLAAETHRIAPAPIHS
jgi:hypothetical protein